jgi:hypothetical protein
LPGRSGWFRLSVWLNKDRESGVIEGLLYARFRRWELQHATHPLTARESTHVSKTLSALLGRVGEVRMGVHGSGKHTGTPSRHRHWQELLLARQPEALPDLLSTSRTPVLVGYGLGRDSQEVDVARQKWPSTRDIFR